MNIKNLRKKLRAVRKDRELTKRLLQEANEYIVVLTNENNSLSEELRAKAEQ